MAHQPNPTGLPLVDALGTLDPVTIDDYCRAAAEYIRQATVAGDAIGKAAQIRLSGALAQATVASLRASGLDLEDAVAGERMIGGGLRSVNADVSEVTETDGVRLAIEIKPVHLAVGRAIWNRVGDVVGFAVNVHLKFPFAVVGGILTVPTEERVSSKNDQAWKSTTHLIERAASRTMRAVGRRTDGDAAHLFEGITVVAFDRTTGDIDASLPATGSGLRWQEFIDRMVEAYGSRFDNQ